MWLVCLGEVNTYNYESYGCAIQQMVADWRLSWFENSPTMDAEFPFGEVQVCTYCTFCMELSKK